MFKDMQRIWQIKQSLCILIISISFITACSSTQQAAKNARGQQAGKNEAGTPWYKKGNGFSVNGNTYSSTATSLSSDSTNALYKARRTAMADLRSGMQEQLEKLRRQLVDQNVSVAGQPDFIWLMRGAVPAKLSNAVNVRSHVVSNNGIYQAYVQVSYSKANLADDLMNVLTQNSSYASAVKNSTVYRNWVSPDSNDSTSTTG